MRRRCCLRLLLPLCMGLGSAQGMAQNCGWSRIDHQAHWQTDVLAVWTIGALSGWFAHRQDIPLMMQLLPDGFAVGFKTRF
jgi:hypothetical protein